MNRIDALTIYTEDYSILYNRWEKSLPLGFKPVSKKIEYNKNVSGFRSDKWFYCIKIKYEFILEYLNKIKNNEIILWSDADIQFFNKNEKLFNITLSFFKKNPNLELLITKEGETNQVNTGFFLIRNSEKIKDFINKIIIACNRKMEFADQTYVNSVIDKYIYDYVPDNITAWGDIIFNKEQVLFHHAVCAGTINKKIKQQDEILLKLKSI